ncbi:unnamed protein product [Cyprideis torosa]|uniref:Uncharacterized protein n=1 Tax=Cyprideis torosa TaxID=163714 RepID=A0A7R8W6J8_9CRUS|nr:unnamed protein product [Cyprideis torosa]CAG0886600.1 unnamed protein product [Cyprideis torosa]
MKSAHGVGGKKPLFLCQMCGKGFPERYQLKQHQLRHEEPKHQCPDCPRKFFTEQQMQSHSKIHTRGRRFQCKDCLKAFVTEKRLQYHMDTEHLGLRPQACPKCPETFKNFLQMRHHVKVVHEGNGKQRPPKDKKPRKKKDIHCIDQVSVQCHNCPKVLRSPIDFYVHQKEKHSSGRECPVCGEWIPSSAKELRNHLKNHNMHRCECCGKEISDSSDHVEQEHGVKVGCPLCKKEVPSRILEGHVKAHSNPKQGCLKCGMWFESMKGLRFHNSEVHLGQAMSQCSLCDKKYHGTWYLKEHMKEAHSRGKQKDQVCKICGESFRNVRNHIKFKHRKKTRCPVCNALVFDSEFSKHMEDHEKGKQHTCKKCGETFIRATLLMSHMHMKHTPKVICTVCGEEVNAVSLSLHLQTHSTVKVKCDQCGREYKNERSLKTHIKDAHPVEDSLLLCQTCGKGFRKKFRLKQHQLRHEEPKHQCPNCPKKFFTEKQVQSHLKIHLRSPRYYCKDCPKAFVTKKRLRDHVGSDHPHSCPKCPERFEDVSKVRHHTKVAHERRGKQRPPKAKKPPKKAEANAASNTSKKHSVRRKKRLHLRIVHEVDAEGFIQCSNCQAKFAVEKFFDHTKEVHGFDEVDVQCPDCPKILVSRIGFSSHRRGKHGPGKECPVCAKSIPSSKTAYKKHLKTHNMHRCQYCGEEISDSSDHVEREHGAKVGCPVCKEDIPERILDGHVKAHSNPKQGCLKCGMCFQSHMGWMKHNRQVHMGRPLDECVLCGKKFPGLYFLKVHMKDSHSQEKTDVCKVCGQAFRKRVSLQSHMLFKHGSKTRCVVCSTLVPDSKLSEHMEDHEKGKQHTCKKCGQTFIRATLLRSHLHQHTPKVICTICGKEVKTNHLRPHLQKHSTVRVKCDQCGREYKNEVTLKVHIRYSHTKRKERPLLLCQSCGKGFREQFKLKQHQLTHGEPKCQCPDCPKKFVTDQQMRKHAKKHTRSRQFEFECSRCLKVFAFAKNLQYHVDTAHLGIRPHACPQCPERFEHVLGLRHHVKVVHDGSGKQGTSKAKKVRSKNSKASDQPAKNVGDVPSEPHALDAKGFVECLECQAKFAVEAFFHHMKDTHGIGEVSIQCHDCPKVLTSRKGFSLHQKGNHGPEKQCPVCRKLIPCSAKEYKTHLKIHNMLVCEYCGKEISDSSDHVEQEHGVKAPCPVCNKDIPDRILAGHVKAHSNPKQGCLKCGMHFDTKKDFLLHNRQVHMGRAVDQCNLCDKRFRGLWHLKQHMKESHKVHAVSLSLHLQKHSTVRSKCGQCGAEYKAERYLKVHMKSAHGVGGKKPLFLCQMCGKGFPERYQLKQHQLRHEELCPKCPETFKNFLQMRHHASSNA